MFSSNLFGSDDRCSKIIMKQRNEFLNSLMIKARELYPFFSNEKEYIDAKYITFIDLDGDMKEAYAKVLKKKKISSDFDWNS